MVKVLREDVVAAARDLFCEKGFAGTSMQDIADRVGLLKSSLYSRFPGKEALVPEALALSVEGLADVFHERGDWRADYETALSALTALLIKNRRCIGLHLAYGLDPESPGFKSAQDFFASLKTGLVTLLRQGIEEDLADTFATETITAIEGATLWLVLNGDDAPMQDVERRLLARADGFTLDVELEDARALLEQYCGNRRSASLAEKRLALRLAEAEAELLTTKAALAGQIAAESCFR